MDQARHDINEAILSYARGIDRLRVDDVSAGFHPGALLHGYGRPEATTIEAFAEYAVAKLRENYVSTQHRLTNTWIEFISDNLARVETYVEASHAEPPADDGTQQIHTFAGRYIDTCTPDEDGTWRIATRTLRNDWSKVETIAEPMRGNYVASGRGDAPDPLFDIRQPIT